MLKGDTDWVTCVLLSTIGKVVVFKSSDETRQEWKMRDREYKNTVLGGPTDMVSCDSVRDNEALIVSGFDKTV